MKLSYGKLSLPGRHTSCAFFAAYGGYPCCCRNNSCRFAATPGGIAAFRKYVRLPKPHIFTKTILKKSIIRAIIL